VKGTCKNIVKTRIWIRFSENLLMNKHQANLGHAVNFGLKLFRSLLSDFNMAIYASKNVRLIFTLIFCLTKFVGEKNHSDCT